MKTSECESWMYSSGSRHESAGSWLVSLLIHSFAVSTAVAAVDFAITPREEPFRWDVVMITAPPPAAVTAEEPTPFQPAPQEIQDIAGFSARPSERRHQRLLKEPPSLAHTKASQQHRAADVSKPAPSLVDGVSPDNTTDSVPPDASTPTQANAALMADATPLIQPTSSALPPPAVETIKESNVTQEPAVMKEERIITRLITERPIQSRVTRPDYGWLIEALWSTVEQLKRYPHIAKMNRWEGRVVVQAAIQNDGQVLNVDIVESSGHSILDQSAIEVLRRASPLNLKHPLGQDRLVLQVPITYRLD